MPSICWIFHGTQHSKRNTHWSDFAKLLPLDGSQKWEIEREREARGGEMKRGKRVLSQPHSGHSATVWMFTKYNRTIWPDLQISSLIRIQQLYHEFISLIRRISSWIMSIQLPIRTTIGIYNWKRSTIFFGLPKSLAVFFVYFLHPRKKRKCEQFFDSIVFDWFNYALKLTFGTFSRFVIRLHLGVNTSEWFFSIFSKKVIFRFKMLFFWRTKKTIWYFSHKRNRISLFERHPK